MTWLAQDEVERTMFAEHIRDDEVERYLGFSVAASLAPTIFNSAVRMVAASFRLDCVKWTESVLELVYFLSHRLRSRDPSDCSVNNPGCYYSQYR